MTNTQHIEATAITPDLTVLYDLREAYKNSTQGEWQKGATTHHTVTETGYKIAEFHHAADASFCDVTHKHTPALLAWIDALTKERDAALALAAERLVDAENYQWLKPRLLCADFSYGPLEESCCALVFEIPDDMRVSANLDESIRAVRQAAKDAS